MWLGVERPEVILLEGLERSEGVALELVSFVRARWPGILLFLVELSVCC